jgi:hypothetical protein
VRLLAAAWLASAAAALYLTGRSAWQLMHDPGQRARYRSRSEMLGGRAGIALALVVSVLSRRCNRFDMRQGTARARAVLVVALAGSTLISTARPTRPHRRSPEGPALADTG